MKNLTKKSLLCFAVVVELLAPKSFASTISSQAPFAFENKEAHEIQLLNKGSSSFYKRIELIRSAKKSIVMEYFIFNHDLVGKIMAEELFKKVKQGVQVKLLVDNFMVGDQLTPHHSAELIKRGIEIKYYSPLPIANAVKVQYRNHRKLFMIDDQQFLIGGRNIGDDYFDLSERYNFVDRDALIIGPSSKIIRKSFDAFFESGHSVVKIRPEMPNLNQLIFLRSGESQKAKIIQEVRAKRRRWKEDKERGLEFLKFDEEEKQLFSKLMTIGEKTFKSEFKGKCNHFEFASDRPLIGPSNDKNRITRHAVVKFLLGAKSKIKIDSPYFILNDELIDVIEGQLDKGVDISLLTNGLYSSDALPVASVFNHYVKSWIEKGLKASVYSGKALLPEEYYASHEIVNSKWGTHSKTMAIDEKLSVIGSYNFDPRSATFSMELVSACHDSPELAKEIENNINFRTQNSIYFKSVEEVEEQEFHNVNMLKQMGYYVVKPLSLLLQGLL